MAVSFFIGGTSPRTELWCLDAATYATGSTNARCGVQGTKKKERERGEEGGGVKREGEKRRERRGKKRRER